MLDSVTRTTLILILTLGIFSLKVERTSADLTAQRTVAGNRLRATTISLDNLHTASFTSLTSLFNTTGFKPTGYDIRSLKIIKTGELDFKYQIRVEPIEGQEEVCNNFSLTTDKNWTETYTGALMEFTQNSQITGDTTDDWLFYLSLNEDPDSPRNASCSFHIYIHTYRNNPTENMTGLWAHKTIANNVTTGEWE